MHMVMGKYSHVYTPAYVQQEAKKGPADVVFATDLLAFALWSVW